MTYLCVLIKTYAHFCITFGITIAFTLKFSYCVSKPKSKMSFIAAYHSCGGCIFFFADFFSFFFHLVILTVTHNAHLLYYMKKQFYHPRQLAPDLGWQEESTRAVHPHCLQNTSPSSHLHSIGSVVRYSSMTPLFFAFESKRLNSSFNHSIQR